MIKDNVEEILEETKEVALLAATKKRTTLEIQQAIDAGLKIIGENYVQEAAKKHLKLKGKVKFHCIGHLQSNKAKEAAELFDMIETVDSEKLAKELDKKCKNINKIMPVLIEVNIGEEPNKDGCMPDKVLELAEAILPLENLKLKGLMTMAPYTENPEDTRPFFRRTKALFEELKNKYPNQNIDTLSMGMTHSYKIAIEEGATEVRIGTKIFGER
jgi:pyridoxal phosphate enzyme (YggS family)